MATAPATATTGTPVFATRPYRTAYRAVVAYPVPLVREGIASLLSAGSRAEVVATGNVLEAVRIAGLRAAELVLFDYTGSDGAGACRLLRAAGGDTTLIALVSNTVSGPADAIGSGADAVIAVNQVTGDAFLEAIRRAEDGERPAVAGFSPASLAATQTGVDLGPLSVLSPRERELLYLIGQGHSNQEIADALVLSIKTVEAHRSNLSRKLNLRSRSALMRLALDAGR
jgi:DNA-binding NarL/FixJ family response regulator